MTPTLTLDLMRRTVDGLHWTRARDLPSNARVGDHVLAADGDVTAVARIVAIDEHWAHLRVLPGPADQHQHLLVGAA